ncbi:MAG: prolyl oligopeptidase family serine peptidase [Gemmatimonadetes bacterium]|nr:prolyl oligopeptidase family serine peptidase [Gemmatimonadota bacterium]
MLTARSARRLAALVVATLTTAPLGAQGAPAAATFTLEDLLDTRTTAMGDMTADGRHVVAFMARPRTSMGVDYNRSFGDPTYAAPTRRESVVIDTRTGVATPLFAEPRVIGATAWAPDGKRLAVLVQRDDDRYDVLLWDPATRRTTPVRTPAGRYAFAGSRVRWSPDGSALFVSLRSDAWRTKAAAEFARLTVGPRIVQSSSEPFLAWNGLQRLGTIESLVKFDLRTGAATDVLPEAMRQQWLVTRDAQRVVYTEDATTKTDYDVIGGSEQKLFVRDVDGGTPRQLFASLRNVRLVWDRALLRYAWLQGDQLMLGTLADTARVRLAGDTTPRTDTTAATRARRARERFTPVAFVEGSAPALVATNAEGAWLIDLATRQRTRLVASSDSQPATPRVRYVGALQDGTHVLLALESRTAWQRAIARFDRSTGRLDTLWQGTQLFGGTTVSENGSTVVLSGGDGNRPGDLWALDASAGALRRLTNANPTLAAKALGPTELLTYLDADGQREFGVVHYPTGYVKGRAYPTVFIIYEDFFADSWDGLANLLNAQGYVVVKPSVRFDIGYPGEAWVKGVTAAANKLIEMGVADSTKLGVQGTSYGGYATNLLITQTNRFKAAINVSGKVDVISFYTDSPRLGVRNVHAAEKSQDRLGATLWEQPQKYIAQSAIMYADRIKTPLLLMTGELDGNVPALNTREMYYALRRLGKEVTWVTYAKGGHGTPLSSLDDWTDFYTRTLDWWARWLKNAPATAPRGP